MNSPCGGSVLRRVRCSSIGAIPEKDLIEDPEEFADSSGRTLNTIVRMVFVLVFTPRAKHSRLIKAGLIPSQTEKTARSGASGKETPGNLDFYERRYPAPAGTGPNSPSFPGTC